MKKKSSLEPDGKQSFSDAMEAHPDFHDEYLNMSEEFFKKENPGYFALMQRLKNDNEGTTKKD